MAAPIWGARTEDRAWNYRLSERRPAPRLDPQRARLTDARCANPRPTRGGASGGPRRLGRTSPGRLQPLQPLQEPADAWGRARRVGPRSDRFSERFGPAPRPPIRPG